MMTYIKLEIESHNEYLAIFGYRITLQGQFLYVFTIKVYTIAVM